MNGGDRVLQQHREGNNRGARVRSGIITHDSHGVECQVAWDDDGTEMMLSETLRPE